MSDKYIEKYIRYPLYLDEAAENINSIATDINELRVGKTVLSRRAYGNAVQYFNGRENCGTVVIPINTMSGHFFIIYETHRIPKNATILQENILHSNKKDIVCNANVVSVGKEIRVLNKEVQLYDANANLRDEAYRPLYQHGIEHFYHCTAKSNIENILAKGLYSRQYLEKEHITYEELAEMNIPDENDIVSLSFSKFHPDYYYPGREEFSQRKCVREKFRKKEIAYLKISIDILKAPALKIAFCDMDHNSMNVSVSAGVDKINLKSIKYNRKAEILVQRHIPAKYITVDNENNGTKNNNKDGARVGLALLGLALGIPLLG
ncbi:MAG: DUF4433 domain-containing protein [Cardiobacteriaceae bacterium]|nr:DUF4433 domain-containing protein [Cardiobacteriaceae bacterium]